MGSYCSFGHLKHKLWPKEGPGVKLPVWLPTRKKLGIDPIYLSADGVRHTLESSQRRLQLCFKSHFDPRFARKVMGLQSRKSPNLGDFGTPTWESRDKKPFGCGPRVEYTINGKVVASPKFESWWVLCVRVARGSS